MRRRREKVQARRNCKGPVENFEAPKFASTPPVPEVRVRPADRYEELLRLYRVEGAEGVRRDFTMEELRRLARVHGFEVRSARSKAQVIEAMFG